MNRRKFLAWLGGTAAGVALAGSSDIEAMLWEPGKKTVFDLGEVPVPDYLTLLCGNPLITPDWITKETLKIFENNLNFAKHINQHYEDTFKSSDINRWVMLKAPVPGAIKTMRRVPGISGSPFIEVEEAPRNAIVLLKDPWK